MKVGHFDDDDNDDDENRAVGASFPRRVYPREGRDGNPDSIFSGAGGPRLPRGFRLWALGFGFWALVER
ncbi:MAG: hypothetical protein FJY65_01050 [Calditrichaeota bacterium]|nr:hypothetical protein [Calditrichota bacterium]